MRYKIAAFLATTFDFRAVAVVRGIGSLLVFGGFAGGAYVFSLEVTRYLLEETQTGLFLFHRFVSMMLFVFFISVNLGNIVVSFATLYKSPEVNFLLTKPVDYSSVFVLKFLDNFLYSSTTLFLVAFMVLLGYGSYLGYSWPTIVGLLGFVLIPYMFLSACFAVLILMALMKSASRWGFRKVMAGVALIYFTLIYIFFEFSNPIKLVEEVGEYYPNFNLYLAHLDPSFAKYLPNHWVSEFLFWMARGDVVRGLPYALLLLAVTAVAFVLVLLVANRFYYRSWMIASTIQSRRPVAPSASPRRFLPDFRRASRLSPQLDVLLKRDFHLFFREPSQWIHFALMLVLISVFVLSIRRLEFILDVPEIPAFTYLVLFAFGGFLMGALALRFIFPMLSLEGRSFWMILSAPVRLRKLYAIKLGVGIGVIMGLGLIVSLFSNLPFVRISQNNPLLLILGGITTFWLSLAMVALNLGFGGYFANYQERNPIRVASSQGATLTFLLNLFLLVVLIGVMAIPVMQYFEAVALSMPFDSDVFVVPTVVFSLLALLSGLVGTAVGDRSLRQDF
jgi:ABC-2 type transport system permease protein